MKNKTIIRTIVLLLVAVSVVGFSYSQYTKVYTKTIDQRPTIIAYDNQVIENKEYVATYTSDGMFYVKDENNAIVYADDTLCPSFIFKDLNDDGNRDLMFTCEKHTDFLLFDTNSQTFKKAKSNTKETHK